ncbi:MAG: peptide ABC transporter substrate-binding protein [Candidatus Rokuibacteriota bacterium]|nr:MAG: peptide ABC transporter substrate-binding protein [Candidatus Rokubacteria bacterium]
MLMTGRAPMSACGVLTLLVLGPVILSLVAIATPAVSQTPATPKSGGVLNAMQREDLPQGFNTHETGTISSVWPVMPCFNNLVLFDPAKKVESVDSIIPELAEKWSWQDNYRNLVFLLRKNVKWHDGQPFTSKDVKYTFDVVREAKDAPAKLRTSPRKDWYANVENIEAPDPHTVIFHLKRPQPALLLMLASGYSPVYPAHVPLAELRTRCVGTGPFKLKEWKRGEYVEYVKNPDYFVKGRPYLDGIRYVVIVERGTKYAALQAGRLDVAFPGESTKTVVDQVKAAVPKMVVDVVSQNVNDNLLMNVTKPPFNNVKIRRAISMAIDRGAYIKAVHQGGAVVGASMQPKPYGVWGLVDKDLQALPGYGKPAEEKEKAKKAMAELGYSSSNPLKTEMATRAIAIYVDFASFVINELKQIGVEASLKQIETAQWHAFATRREYGLGANLTGIGVDDPDANFYENYACTSPRNYTGYCDEQVGKMFDTQSQELDPKKRYALVAQIQKKLEEEAARPMMGWRLDYFAQWPHVKGLVPHHNLYNYGRMQDVWLDK